MVRNQLEVTIFASTLKQIVKITPQCNSLNYELIVPGFFRSEFQMQNITYQHCSLMYSSSNIILYFFREIVIFRHSNFRAKDSNFGGVT